MKNVVVTRLLSAFLVSSIAACSSLGDQVMPVTPDEQDIRDRAFVLEAVRMKHQELDKAAAQKEKLSEIWLATVGESEDHYELCQKLKEDDPDISELVAEYNTGFMIQYRMNGFSPIKSVVSVGSFRNSIENYYKNVEKALMLCSWKYDS